MLKRGDLVYLVTVDMFLSEKKEKTYFNLKTYCFEDFKVGCFSDAYKSVALKLT